MLWYCNTHAHTYQSLLSSLNKSWTVKTKCEKHCLQVTLCPCLCDLTKGLIECTWKRILKNNKKAINQE